VDINFIQNILPPFFGNICTKLYRHLKALDVSALHIQYQLKVRFTTRQGLYLRPSLQASPN